MAGTERNSLIVGITGGIGSGKSYLCRALRERGWHVYDTDSRAKWLIVHDPEVRTEIIRLFGPEVYEGDRYCTEKVAPMVFADPDLLRRLNDIVHPAVRREVASLRSLSLPPSEHPFPPSGKWIIESAILFSSGLNELCDYTVWVDAPLEVRIERAMRRDGAVRAEVEARIRSQQDDSDRCDLVLINDGLTPLTTLLQPLTTLPTSHH